MPANRQTQDLRLIQEYLAGNTESFGEIYDYYSAPLYRFIYYKTQHTETAEDLLSQTFYKILASLKSYDSQKSSFQTWAYQIARNAVIDHYRTMHLTTNIEDAFDLSCHTDLGVKTDAKLKLEKVIEHLHKFRPMERELIFLRVWDELSYAEISQILGKTESSLKMTFSRAVAKLSQDFLMAVLIYFFTVL